MLRINKKTIILYAEILQKYAYSTKFKKKNQNTFKKNV